MYKYFGTDGFRGVANAELMPEHAFKIGRFLGYHFSGKAPAKILIGKDTRRSGYMLESALASGIAASGADAYLLHVTTTASVSYLVSEESFDCGIMISASHNPFFDNGIKLISSSGEKMDGDIIHDIEAYLDSETDTIPHAERDSVGRVVDFADGRARYADFIVRLADRSYEGLKIGLDCANGSAWKMAKEIFQRLGAETYIIGNNPNGLNINLSCGSTHIEALKQLVIDNKLDIGLAFDGDADRCLVIDEKGNYMSGDHIMYICGKHMKKHGLLKTNTVVTTVMSNFGLYKAFDELKIDYLKTAVGDKYVWEAMKEGSHLIGGEQSGHIIHSDCLCTGDGLISAVKLMQVVLDEGLPVSKLHEELVIFPQVLKNVIVTDKDETLNDEFVIERVKELEAQLGKSGRILLRKSGTEPVLRVMAEAETLEMCNKVVDSIIDSMNQKGYLVEVK